ncbi:MAG: hypothetical protein AAGC72_11305 [Planctomycetota bacterium]
MPRRIEVGTDIASIGVWDPVEPYPDKPADAQAFIQQQAKAGRLFYIVTGADGGYQTDFYIGEQPDPEILDLYTKYSPEYLIESRSGRLIAGGLEDFANPNPQMTSSEDELVVTPGRYVLSLYELDEDRYLERLDEHVSKEDMDYYGKRCDRGCTGCCLFYVIALLLVPFCWVLMDLWPWLWWIAAIFPLIGTTYLLLYSRRLDADTRFKGISQRIAAVSEQYPALICVLDTTELGEPLEGGWHELH